MKKFIEGLAGFGYEALVCLAAGAVGVIVSIFLGTKESITIYSGIIVLVAMGATFAWARFAKSGETALNVALALIILAAALGILYLVFTIAGGGG